MNYDIAATIAIGIFALVAMIAEYIKIKKGK